MYNTRLAVVHYNVKPWFVPTSLWFNKYNWFLGELLCVVYILCLVTAVVWVVDDAAVSV